MSRVRGDSRDSASWKVVEPCGIASSFGGAHLGAASSGLPHQKSGRRLRLDTAHGGGYEKHMANDGWVRVSAVGEIAPGEGRVVEVGGRTLAVFNVDGAYYAIDNTCSHRGGPLGDGDLEGTVVSCPWHAWRWDVTSGANVNNPAVRVACFRARVQDGAVFVHLAS